mmetsp:Transcript_1123/g.2372  ORF Transcript_1123/g.2372 Transcript_1123/m.2372 type:complete len:81 (+) Transcript_1123:996-1238(+)
MRKVVILFDIHLASFLTMTLLWAPFSSSVGFHRDSRRLHRKPLFGTHSFNILTPSSIIQHWINNNPRKKGKKKKKKMECS